MRNQLSQERVERPRQGAQGELAGGAAGCAAARRELVMPAGGGELAQYERLGLNHAGWKAGRHIVNVGNDCEGRFDEPLGLAENQLLIAVASTAERVRSLAQLDQPRDD